MKTKNSYWIIAGGINLLGALIHTTLGQVDLVSPLINSNLNIKNQTEWLGVWHMATAILFYTSFIYLKNGFKNSTQNTSLITFISNLYLLFSLGFIIVNIYNSTLGPQWGLLLPIGIFGWIGIKKQNIN